MASYILKISSAAHPTKYIPISRLMALRTEPGAQYAILDANKQIASDVMLTQKGATLAVEAGGQKLVYLNGYYNPGVNAAFDTGAGVANAAAPTSTQVIAEPVAETAVDPVTGTATESAAETSTASSASSSGGFMSGMSLGGNTGMLLLGGVAVAGLAAAAASGGGGDDKKGGTNSTDTTAPNITSLANATAIAEGSGANQVVYDANATDDSGNVVYSIKENSGNASSFTIDSSSGKVTLKDNPDHTVTPEYKFTVVATDPSGNNKEFEVTLPITSTDTTPPSIISLAINSAEGAQNGYLNAGDKVFVTVEISEASTVTGTPKLKLIVGEQEVKADYVSGNDSTSLVFSYTILAGQVDLNGISIPTNALELNGATIKDVRNNTMTSSSNDTVSDNASYKVDATAPNISLATPIAQQLQSGQNKTGSYPNDINPQSVADDDRSLLIWSEQKSDGNYRMLTQKVGADGKNIGSVNIVDTNSATSSNTGNPIHVTRVTNDDNSYGYIATWSQSTTAPWVREIYVQRLDENGAANGTAYKVSANSAAALNIDGEPQVSTVGNKGGYVVVWDGYTETLSTFTDLKPRRIYVQRFDKDDNAISTPIELSVDNTAIQGDFTPSVANLGQNGAFAVAWKGRIANEGDFTLVQNFDTNGQASGNPIKLGVLNSSLTTQNNSQPILTELASDGSFIAVWLGQFDSTKSLREVLVQKFNSNGSLSTSAPIELQTSQTGNDTSPSTTDLGSGKFIVTWQGNNSAGGKSIFVQSFKADGTKASSSPTQLDVNNVAAVNAVNTNPDVIGLSDGGYVIAWSGKDTFTHHGDSSIYLQQFKPDGSTTGLPQIMLEASNMVTGADIMPKLTALADGGYLVSWQGQDRSGVNGAFFQRFSASGELIDSNAQDKLTIIGEAVTVQASETGDIYLVNDLQSITSTSDLVSLNNATQYVKMPITEANTTISLSTVSLTPGSYSVYAVDQAGNLSSWSNKVDISGVKSVAISGATNDVNGILPTGGVLQLSVTLNRDASVSNSTSNPLKLDLNLGGDIVEANYKSNSLVNGNRVLIFEYVIEANQFDSNGIAIIGDSLRGGNILQNGAELVRQFVYVPDNDRYTIDAQAPQVAARATVVGKGDLLHVNSSEDGTIYLIDANVTFTNVNQFTDLSSTQALKLSAIAGITAELSTSDLALGNYKLYATDTVGNLSNANETEIVLQPKANVVFDLVEGVSSDHSNRTFDANTTYTIYVRVDSDTATVSTDGIGPKTSSNWGSWSGADKLGNDDKITLVGNGSNIQDNARDAVSSASYSNSKFFWIANTQAQANYAARLSGNGSLLRQWNGNTAKVDLWSGEWSTPNHHSQLAWADIYLTTMPNGVLTSQGLA